ncbi:hypothetical protein BA171_02035 [Candidatus Hamiltonella defensa (Bemisia tabaci)]|uniref:Uncharacterized protein n=2 Tax=Candidatus Williamhamiltonella defendens TaxID=138072 RepID=A0A249DWX9_9ENTR|nr:hypothetical protein BA171_02035 [Candidatus Hamiltonella defensa (Bemisia tabaci)]
MTIIFRDDYMNVNSCSTSSVPQQRLLGDNGKNSLLSSLKKTSNIASNIAGFFSKNREKKVWNDIKSLFEDKEYASFLLKRMKDPKNSLNKKMDIFLEIKTLAIKKHQKNFYKNEYKDGEISFYFNEIPIYEKKIISALNEIKKSAKTENKDTFLINLKILIDEIDKEWLIKNKNNEEELLDHEARREFNREIITRYLFPFASEKVIEEQEQEQILDKMEGAFGKRLRGMMEFTAYKVGNNVEDPALISAAYKYQPLMEDFIIILRQQLKKEEKIIDKPEYISTLEQLTKSEIDTLRKINIHSSVLELD